MSELVAVAGDQDDHLLGDFICDNVTKVFISGKKVATINSNAEADGAHPEEQTYAFTGSAKVFVQGNAIHRNNDLRKCNAKTIVTNQTKVFCG